MSNNATQAEKPGRLLSYRDARRCKAKAYVYGFPLDNAGLKYCGDRIKPIPPEVTDYEELANARLQRAAAISKHVIKACAAAWPLGRLRTVMGYSEGKLYTLIAFAACTQPYLEEHIPRGETLEKLKVILADEGFKQEPRWFLMTS